MRLKRFFRLAVFFLIFYLFSGSALANNKFGIHILEPAEVYKAVELVNSSGGDWGYVTIVLREEDFNQQKWQEFFDDCRQLHIIPIVRLATKMLPEGVWAKPNLDDLEKWPNFLNSLNWPVKKQIVIVFNEPNQAKEWGGEINPEEYALVLNKLISLFKERDSNFFILPAGFDQAATNSEATMDELVFLNRVFTSPGQLLEKIDGWASHSYPNHGYIGLPQDTGKASIKGYQWELQALKDLGLKKQLDVYITETGWPHQEGISLAGNYYDQNKTAELIQQAFKLWQEDEKVVAITPFVLNFPVPPFDHFSWLDKDGNYYSQFAKIKEIEKQTWRPEQKESYQVIKLDLIDLLPTDYVYKAKVVVKNTGQWIMGERGELVIPVEKSSPANGSLQISPIKLKQNNLIFPGGEYSFDLTIQTATVSGEHKIKIGNLEKTIYVFKPWELKNEKISFWRQIIARLRLWWHSFREK